MRRPDLPWRAVAEAMATFTLVFAGCGAIVSSSQYSGSLGNLGIALTFGLVIVVMVYATGHLSGAQFLGLCGRPASRGDSRHAQLSARPGRASRARG